MTPDRLKQLNQLHRNVEGLEQALRIHHNGESLGGYVESHASPDSVKRARKILQDDLESHLAEAKRLFAAADAPHAGKPAPRHPDAPYIHELRIIAETIESGGARVFAYSRGVGVDQQQSVTVEWREPSIR